MGRVPAISFGMLGSDPVGETSCIQPYASSFLFMLTFFLSISGETTVSLCFIAQISMLFFFQACLIDPAVCSFVSIGIPEAIWPPRPIGGHPPPLRGPPRRHLSLVLRMVSAALCHGREASLPFGGACDRLFGGYAADARGGGGFAAFRFTSIFTLMHKPKFKFI